MSQKPKLNIEVRDREWRAFKKAFPEGVDMLYFIHVGNIKDLATLKNLYLVFTTVLERLVQIDSAYAKNPKIDLYDL